MGGVGEDLLTRLRQRGAYREITFKWSGKTVIMIDPEFTKVALDDLGATAGVSVLLHSYLIEARSESEVVREVVVADHGGVRRIRGGAFVDASGDGDLAHHAGALVSAPVPDQRQAATLSMRIGGVSPDAVISSESMRRAVALNATHERQLTRDHGPAARLPLTGELTMQIVDQRADALDARDLTRAEIAARSQAWDYLEAFREHLDGWADAYLVATGPQIGIRESRHVIGRYAVSRDDVLSAGRRVGDRAVWMADRGASRNRVHEVHPHRR